MTIFAFPFLYLVENIRVLSFGNFFMTFYTNNILMFSIEFKGSCVMIKVPDLPSFKIMAFQAICYALVLKLFKMDILMTCCASR